MLNSYKPYKNLIIIIITSLFLLLGWALGIIQIDMNNNQINQTPILGYHPDTEQWLKRFVSHESNSWTVQDIVPMSGDLLISPNYSRHIREKTIMACTDELFIRLYNITDQNSISLLKDRARAGTKIKMILENDKFGPDEQQEPRGWGIQVRNDAKLHTNFVHAKTFVSSGFFIIQTANLTHSAWNKQREYYVVGHDPQIISNLQMLFMKDREGHDIDMKDIHPNLVFCGIDCRYKITELLQSAQSSIRIQNQYIEDKEIIGILSDKINQGIDVKITLPEGEDEKAKDLPFDQELRFLTKPRIHAKALLIDEKYFLVSSINLSTNSLDNNREIGIIITDPTSIGTFIKQFNEDRNHSQYGSYTPPIQ